MLIYIVIITFFALILYLEIGIHILVLNPRNRINRMFFLTCFLFSVWVFGYFMFVQSADYNRAWFWIRFSSIGFYLMPPVAANFFFLLSGRKRVKPVIVTLLLYLPGLFYVAMMLTGRMFFETIVYTQDSQVWRGFSSQRNWMFWVYPNYLLACFVFIIAASVKWYASAKIPIEKRQAGMLVATNAATFAAGLIASLFLVSNRDKDVRLFSLAYSSVSIVWVVGVWFSILKHKLFITQSNPIIPQILSNISAAALVTDLHVSIAYMNEVFGKLTGYDTAELNRMHPGDFFDAEFVERLKGFAAGSIDADSGEEQTVSAHCREGDRRMTLRIRGISDGKGVVVGFLILMFPEDAVRGLSNGYNLTKREIEVAKLLAQGLTNREICDMLFISLATVKTHIINIYRKLSIRNKVELTNLLSRVRRD